MGLGIGMGNFSRGYDKAVDRRDRKTGEREDREWKLGRRERKLEQEEWNDPMIRGAAEREQSAGIRTERRESAAELYKLADDRREEEQSVRNAEYNKANQDPRMRGIERRESAEIGQEELRSARQPGAMAGIGYADRAAQQQDELSTARQPGAMAGVGYADTAAQQKDELAVAGQPGAMEQQGFADQQARDQSEYDTAQMEGWRERQDDLSYKRDSDNAIGEFERSGNPQGIEDFYNDVYENDEEVSIERLADGRYQATYTDPQTGATHQSDPVTKEELLRETAKFFADRPDTALPQQGAGGIGGAYRGPSGKGGAGQRGTTLKQSAYEREVYMNVQSLMETQNLSAPEAMAIALQRANQKSGKPQQEVAREYFTAMFEMLMADADMAEDPEAYRANAEKEASAMTKRFMGMDFGGYNSGAGINQNAPGPAPQGGARQPTAQHIKTLREEDTPQLRATFNGHFGEGAAERLLNEK